MTRIETTAGVPLFVLGKDDKPEDIAEKYCFIVASDGFHVKKSNCLYDAVTKVDKLDFLGEIKDEATYYPRKLARRFFESILAFFGAVYEARKAEAAVLLFYDFENERWAYGVPSQEVGAASVKYDAAKGMKYVLDDAVEAAVDALPDGFKQVGSIHSHAAMGAFHSGTDDKDEFNFDGLHITIGNLDKGGAYTFSGRWILGGIVATVQAGDVVEGEGGAFPKELTSLVSEYKYTTVGWDDKDKRTWGGRRHGGYGLGYGYGYEREDDDAYLRGAAIVSGQPVGATAPAIPLAQDAPCAGAAAQASPVDSLGVAEADELGLIIHEN